MLGQSDGVDERVLAPGRPLLEEHRPGREAYHVEQRGEEARKEQAQEVVPLVPCANRNGVTSSRETRFMGTGRKRDSHIPNGSTTLLPQSATRPPGAVRPAAG